MNRQSTKDFQDSETILYNTILVNTGHYTCVKTHRMYNTKNEPKYKLKSLGDNEASMQVHQL